jgi:exopolysaccharide biosynthesis protein
MKNKKVIFSLLFLFFAPIIAKAQTPSNLVGRILLDVERHGEAWYVFPADKLRYSLGRPDDAFKVMRQLGLGIKEVEFQKIAQSGMPISGDIELAKSLAGKIILQVERNGEAWYINPADLKKYYLGRPADAFRVMRELGLGITRKDLAFIHKKGMDESINAFSSYEHRIVKVASGEFTADIIKIDLRNPKLKVITDSANVETCKTSCPAKPLINYVTANKAFAAINGTYFCSSSGCGARNYSFYPVFNTNSGKLINEDQLKYWTTGPIIAFDANNKFYYFKDSREFGGVEYFTATTSLKLTAAMGCKPRLIQDSMNYLIEWELDQKQLKAKALRNAVGYKDNILYLVIINNATVPDLGEVMQSLGVEYALNLDGGYSSALFYNDEMMVGPGRDIPNAILFAESD